MLNCGYGRGYSVLELLDAVQRVSGRTLDIRARARRAGDMPVMVAAADAIHASSWEPRYDDINLIVAHALAWESSWCAASRPSETHPSRAQKWPDCRRIKHMRASEAIMHDPMK